MASFLYNGSVFVYSFCKDLDHAHAAVCCPYLSSATTPVLWANLHGLYAFDATSPSLFYYMFSMHALHIMEHCYIVAMGISGLPLRFAVFIIAGIRSASIKVKLLQFWHHNTITKVLLRVKVTRDTLLSCTFTAVVVACSIFSPGPECVLSLMQYKLTLPKQGSINDLLEEMARLSGLDKRKVCVWCVCECECKYVCFRAHLWRVSVSPCVCVHACMLHG